jgi:hypothetical protein
VLLDTNQATLENGYLAYSISTPGHSVRGGQLQPLFFLATKT